MDDEGVAAVVVQYTTYGFNGRNTLTVRTRKKLHWNVVGSHNEKCPQLFKKFWLNFVKFELQFIVEHANVLFEFCIVDIDGTQTRLQ